MDTDPPPVKTTREKNPSPVINVVFFLWLIFNIKQVSVKY